MAFKIITDSASDLPKDLIEKYDLKVIPTPVIINGKDRFDGQDIFPEEFYSIQASGAEISTYHINEYMFRQAFEPYAIAGDEVLYMCFSTGVAGTFGAANMAKEDLLGDYPDFKITIIDTKCASLGFGLAVSKVLRMQENGAPREVLIEAAEYFCSHMEHVFTVETLEYLYRGGRISRPAAKMGGVLNLKPIIIINKEGALESVEKVRGRLKSLHRCIEMVGERGAALEDQVIGVVHGNASETCDMVAEELMDRYHCKGIMKSWVGCAIGAHTGPGIIGIVFLNASQDKYLKWLGND